MQQITYGLGQIYGVVAYDTVSFLNVSATIPMKFIGALSAQDMQGNAYDGIIGMMPNALGNSTLLVN